VLIEALVDLATTPPIAEPFKAKGVEPPVEGAGGITVREGGIHARSMSSHSRCFTAGHSDARIE
jgi:hypothetical protein